MLCHIREPAVAVHQRHSGVQKRLGSVVAQRGACKIAVLRDDLVVREREGRGVARDAVGRLVRVLRDR